MQTKSDQLCHKTLCNVTDALCMCVYLHRCWPWPARRKFRGHKHAYQIGPKLRLTTHVTEQTPMNKSFRTITRTLTQQDVPKLTAHITWKIPSDKSFDFVANVILVPQTVDLTSIRLHKGLGFR